MALSIYTIDNEKKWDEIVTSVDAYDVFFLSGYVKAFMLENPANGIPLLFVYEDNIDKAINVVFKRDISKTIGFEDIAENTLFDLISPYGYGGFIGSVTNYDNLNKEYTSYCLNNGIICEFVRFNLFGEYYKNYPGVVKSNTHNVVRSLDMSDDEMWMDFKPKVRKNVKRAIQNNLEIIVDDTGEYLDDFLRIYYGTMERSNAEKHFFFSKGFFKTINSMTGHFVYFHIKHNEEIISTELVIIGSNNCYSYLGGTNHQYFDLRPNDLLKYEIIKWANKKGLNNFVLGGGYGADDGIFQYKVCLAPHGVVDFHIGKRIFDIDKYDYLCKKRNIESHSLSPDEIVFFPEYRQ